MIEYDKLQHHHASEAVAKELKSRLNRDDISFFRLMAAYYFTVAASSMRTMIRSPEGKKVPVGFYGINLAPSGYGKTASMNTIETEVLKQFQSRFIEESFPTVAQDQFPKLANTRAARNGSDPDHELEIVKGEFGQTGPYLFTFSSGTPAGLMQMRHKLLMAKAGSLNLVMDEAGDNFTKSKDMLDVFLELYDGRAKDALNKNTKESQRRPSINGSTPANMILFGAPNKFLDSGQNEAMFTSMLETGHARRSFFGYISMNTVPKIPTLEEALKELEEVNGSTVLADLDDKFGRLAEIINFDQTLIMPDASKRMYVAYKLDCMKRATEFKVHEEILRNEMGSRFYKTLKLAGAYAFVDGAVEIGTDHLGAAIKMAEESGEALRRMLKREKPYMKLARYIADINEEVTETDLVEELPFFPKAQNQRRDLMSLAITWGYKNNIIIKRAVTDGIEFLRGESLAETNLDKIIVSYSNDIAVGYKDDFAPFDQLHKLTQANGMHWINHHVKDGERKDEKAIPGFNAVVIDVDGGVSLKTAQLLLKDYKALYYTTKRHTESENRFRIILPTSHVLKLDSNDFKEFMKNIYEWLPFETDTGCGQRNKKWLAHAGHYEYTDGQLLDVLQFIPKTKKNEERRKFINDHASLDNLERWVIGNIGDGNRNNMLLRYAMILVDSGFDANEIKTKVFDLNDKLPDKLDQAEIVASILVSVSKAIAARP